MDIGVVLSPALPKVLQNIVLVLAWLQHSFSFLFLTTPPPSRFPNLSRGLLPISFPPSYFLNGILVIIQFVRVSLKSARHSSPLDCFTVASALAADWYS